MIKNQQPPEPRSSGTGETLWVNSIFETIQGEGPFAGQRATFIRLAGCNLQCPLCDTEYTERTEMTVAEIAGKQDPSNPPKLVVITGGEPFRQPIEPLIWKLLTRNRTVQIETNGKLPPANPNWFGWLRVTTQQPIVVVSPKTATIHPFWEKRADAFKYVVREGNLALDGLPIRALDHPVPDGQNIARPPEDWVGPIFVQPADEQDEEQNAWNMQAAVRSVMRYGDPRRRLCLQMHKYADLP